jgi:type IV pilus assembly protein PilA
MHRLKSYRAAGFSLIELLVVIAIILIIMGLAVPPLANARMQALETGAQKAIITIHTAQAQYQSQYGRYASTLAELGPPTGLISRSLASGVKGGYKFRLQQTEQGYAINADPVTFKTTGRLTFYSDQSLIIHQNPTAEPATADSPEVDPK